jgi:hypothetical protein
MNRYILIRRLRGPALLLLIGDDRPAAFEGVIESFWRWSWPLYLILLACCCLPSGRHWPAADGYPPCGGIPARLIRRNESQRARGRPTLCRTGSSQAQGDGHRPC